MSSMLVKAQSVALIEYKKVLTAYDNLKDISFNVDVYAYDSPYDKTPELYGSGFVYKSGTSYHSKFSDEENISSNEMSLCIDHETKTMDIFEYKMPQQNKEFLKGIDKYAQDALLSFDSSIVYKGISDGKKHFVILTPGEDIVQSDLYVDPATNLFTKIVYYYNTAKSEDFEMGVNRIIIYYKNISLAKPSEDWFSFKKYISRNETGIKVMPSFKGYKINYHDFKERKQHS